MTRILSLDDDHDMQFLSSLILEGKGYEHLAALNSDEAWAILHTMQVDLFMIDLMSDMWDFCRMMETDKTLLNIPVILTSGRITIEGSFSLPKIIKTWIMKPFAISDFLSTIEKILQDHGKPLPTSTEVEFWANFHRQSIEKRLAALRDHNPATRRRAVWSLWQKHEANEKVVQALINMLDDDNWVVRLSAVRVLAHLKDRHAREPLQRLITQVPSEKLNPQKFTKQTLNTQWNVEVSLARWAQWSIKQIEASQ